MYQLFFSAQQNYVAYYYSATIMHYFAMCLIHCMLINNLIITHIHGHINFKGTEDVH